MKLNSDSASLAFRERERERENLRTEYFCRGLRLSLLFADASIRTSCLRSRQLSS